MPVSQILGGEGLVCVFSEYSIAQAYKTNYSDLARSQIRSLEIIQMSKNEISRMNLLSNKISGIALNPSLTFGNFSCSKIIRLDEL